MTPNQRWHPPVVLSGCKGIAAEFYREKGLSPQSIFPRGSLSVAELHCELLKTSGQLCPGGLNRGWHSQCDPPAPASTAVAKLNRAGVSQPSGHSLDPGAGVMPEHGMAQHGMAQHGMVWYSLLWHDTAQYGVVWHGKDGTEWHRMVHHQGYPCSHRNTTQRHQHLRAAQSHPGQASSSREGGSFNLSTH